ncbi:hypothetical protein INT44_008210 [Umbelopsis vinacea]|uniref:Uncharacterized protein n=1 Tax=Umbelopsis vinacea TaxID=44442 RepID=A0A8H7U9V2_9FUNG|nr:hypothetical protein INT44_008210 [Umbelopsis vinacea]
MLFSRLFGHKAILTLVALSGCALAAVANHKDSAPAIKVFVPNVAQAQVHSVGSIPLTGSPSFAMASARNSELGGLVQSITQLEKVFNSKYHYPYVILNDAHFTDEFISTISNLTESEVKFGFVEKDMWGYPDWVDQKKAADGRAQAVKDNVPYADSESYRHMCRFQSGYFFRHPLMMDYQYYWRVEPGVSYHCDVDYDVFGLMAAKKYKYGWTLSLTDYPATLKTFWPTVVDWMKKHPEWMTTGNSSISKWIHDDDKNETYNFCHFWSNFEVGDLNWLRSEQYVSYFEHLDKSGGFFYERWGDAPVHSVAVALMLKESEVHFFNDIGYTHPPFMHCPTEPEMKSKCNCDPAKTFETGTWQCNPRMLNIAPNYKWSMDQLKKETQPFAYKKSK